TIDEIIGGYDDWLKLQPKTEPAVKKPKAPPNTKKARPRRLSFKEKHELEELPKRIEKLESEQAELHAKLADPNIYKDGDGSLITALQERLQTIENDLEEAYLRWDELEKIPES
ncbi:MAG: ABC transporter ATP-binding protein, partial [Desulfuromonadaceae bacterium]|nr:ABC transporter ATP-binding protein [Desulfuromonadaceae bacterium]